MWRREATTRATEEEAISFHDKDGTTNGEVADMEEPQLHNIGDYDDDFEDDPAEKAKSIYSINNVTTDVPM